MSIFISTGELSGDIYAAKLCESMRTYLPDEEFWGMGGGGESGINCEWSNSALHIMGLSGVMKSLPALLRLRREMSAAVIARRPRAVIVFDSPDFHIPLLARIRSLGYAGPVVYVCPPTIWAWRKGRAKKLRRYCDLTLPLFRFEAEALEEQGVKIFWCGHPLIDRFKDYAPELRSLKEKTAPALFGGADDSAQLPRDPRRVAILPGSRRSEVFALMPVLEVTARRLREMGFHPVFSVAPGLDAESRERILQGAADCALSGTTGPALMCQSRFVIGASGTTAVEAMLLDKFMIVVYKGTALEWRLYKMMTNTQLISIPNILSPRVVYPELLQDDVTAENILSHSLKYLKDADYRRDVHELLTQCRAQLGEPGAMNRWAEIIADLIK